MKCVDANRRCREEGPPGHGPYSVLFFEVNGGKTSRSVPTARAAGTRAQVEECQRRRRLVSELIRFSEALCAYSGGK